MMHALCGQHAGSGLTFSVACSRLQSIPLRDGAPISPTSANHPLNAQVASPVRWRPIANCRQTKLTGAAPPNSANSQSVQSRPRPSLQLSAVVFPPWHGGQVVGHLIADGLVVDKHTANLRRLHYATVLSKCSWIR